MSLSYDLQEATRVLATDPPMGRLIERVGPCGLEVRVVEGPFHALMRSVVYQQLSGKAAATIYGRVLALFPGDGLPAPEAVLSRADEELRGAGLSRAKTKALKDLAAKTVAGVVPPYEVLHAMDNEEVIKRLTAVWGVGSWTVEMMLMFYLGRPDVLPVKDLGVQKGFMLAYGLDEKPTPEALLAHGERWRPYRTVASWYLWRALDLVDLPG